ncbi:MAG: MFS transporter [Deltaproteobacteria bacterium]|nr:MFS transporter [Deltaproteobacteria bacterium]
MNNPRIFVLIAVLLGGMGQGVVAPKLPELLHESGALFLSSGISATLMYFAIFISTFKYGTLADRGKVHLLLGFGLLFYAGSLLALGLAPNQGVVFAVRFVEGLAMSAVFVAADFVLGRLSAASERAQWLSYYGVALSIGLLLGPTLALVSGKLGATVGLRDELASSPLFPLGIVAAFSVALCAPGFLTRVAPIENDGAGTPPLHRGALLTGVVYGFMEAALVAVFPVLAVKEFHVRPEYCLLTVILSAAVSSVVWGYLADKRGAAPIATLLVGGLAVGCAAFALGHATLGPSPTAFGGCIFFGILAGGLYPVGFAWLLEGLPESAYGYASGGFARAYGLGSLSGPLAVGAAAQYFGSTGLFAAMLSASGLGLLGIFYAPRNRRLAA